MGIRFIEESDNFVKTFNKLDKIFQKRVAKLIQKLIENPATGKPMRYGRRGTREVYIKPFRLSYIYLQKERQITLIDIYHKRFQ